MTIPQADGESRLASVAGAVAGGVVAGGVAAGGVAADGAACGGIADAGSGSMTLNGSRISNERPAMSSRIVITIS